MTYSRYAIYYTVPQGPLAAFGASWLGWNAATGERPDAPVIDGLPAPAHALTATPRKYGLHGTVKPPFRLAGGTSFNALRARAEAFCATQAAVALDGLEICRLGGFLALTPQGDTAALSALAAAAVEAFEPFRAPLSEADLARRRKSGLTDRQEALLQRWGYPYVMEEFRFHITLTGRLDTETADQVQQALRPRIAPLLPRPFVIDALTLCGEDADGMFHELHRYALSA